jgi:glycosyltransferase involved in cell wall biosynthesis
LGRKAVKIANKLGIPVTAGFHAQAENLSSHVFLKDWKFAQKLIYKNFYNHFYNGVTAVHYPTEFIRNVFEGAVKKETNGYVISNGVNKRFIRKKVEKPSEFKDKFVIMFTGRYSKEKSHKVLIDAVAKSKYKDKIQLIFAGCGPLEDKLKRYSKKKLSVQPIFKFFDRESMVETMNFADLYVHPAEIEIEAIACLEAIACGVVPVIANSQRCATKAFALDEKNLFKNKSSKDLKEKIEFWLDNPDEKQKRSEDYLGYASQFDQDVCMDKMEKMLCDAIELNKKA